MYATRFFSRFSLCIVISAVLVLGAVLLLATNISFARNILTYKNTLSDSAPSNQSNHTFSFIIDTDVPPEGYFEISPPPEFTVSASSTFSAERNVELYVDGTPRTVGPTLSASDDQVTITPGSPGSIRYTLNQTGGINSGSAIELRIGNHTSNTEVGYTEVSTTTGTTTVPGDIEPITNPETPGTYAIDVRAYNQSGDELANAGFLVAIIEAVGVGPIDTTEEVPPFRFNGQPTGQLSGTTVSVEITLETDEFAICRYSTTAGVSYDAMPFTFSNTGLLFHSQVVTVVPASVNTFYVRCVDDEGNKNIDDYLITFTVNERPTGTSNTDGQVDGDGTGTGNSGTGSGGGGGGTSGSSDGQAPTTGGESGGGGSGGGGGGGSGGGSGARGGGGFEGTDGPYRSGDGQVIITGYASPRAQVTVLVDGKVAETGTADGSGQFSVTIDEIARGAYTFGIYATDAANTKSSTFSTSFSVAGARTSSLSNINIPPSILVTPDPVNPGQTLTISGYTLPNATVTIENEKDKNTSTRRQFTATAGSNGAWSTTVDTTSFSAGTYKVRAKSSQSTTLFTNYSQYVLYGVGQAANRGSSSDLNRDGRVNLTDFSILLFWWNTAGGDSEPPADISQDGRVNLTDFSILLFNWTG